MYRIISTILLLNILTSIPLKKITDYDEYLGEWKSMVPTELIHDVSSLATNKELCHGLQCKYHYY